MRPHRSIRVLPLVLALLASPALADEPELFAKGKPPTWADSKMDERFAKTRIAQALSKPPSDPACGRVVATMLAAFAEGAPYYHKRDQNFFLDPQLVGWFQEQLGSGRFPALAYLQMMVRRTRIDGHAPEAWLATAKALKAKLGTPIDLDRLAYAVDGPQLIDSFLFTLPMLEHRYRQEIVLATSIGKESAFARFEGTYLDRDVAWNGLLLSDIKRIEPEKPKARGKKAPPPVAPQETEYWATLLVPTQAPPTHPLFRAPPTQPMVIRARLQTEQYVDVKRAVRAGRYMVVGRLWEMKPGDGEPTSPLLADIELRDALLFEDRDWSTVGQLPGIATAADIEACELAVNDLSERGLREKQSLGKTDPFAK